MANNQHRSIRKVSGSKYIAGNKQKAHELGGLAAHTTVADSRVKVKRVMGGNTKTQLLSANKVIIADGKTSKTAIIEAVVTNPANIHFTRRNVMTKGTIVKTDLGEVVITSRPGQSAQLFGKLK
jgi:small subunit ribosomal protein S8e